MKRLGPLLTGINLAIFSVAAVCAPLASATVSPAGVVRYLEKGQPPVVIHLTVEQAQSRRAAHAAHGKPGGGGSTTNNLIYQGGTVNIGVETAPKIYLVFWGSQWINNDPSGEAALLESFFGDMGGSSWLNSVTQYCQDIKKGTIFCNGAGTPAGNQTGMFNVNYDFWYDNTSAAPAMPKQSDLAAEAVHAAEHFGNTAAGSNNSVQYVIATASGDYPQGFRRTYCAWHSYTNSSYGNVAYTNLPYIPDAGASCGANINGLGANAGVTIVEGHEAAETITDQFPSGGWLDSNGSENGDKCVWITSGQGAVTNVTLNTNDGNSYPVQSLWSNTFNSGSGGCVLSYP